MKTTQGAPDHDAIFALQNHIFSRLYIAPSLQHIYIHTRGAGDAMEHQQRR